MLAMTTLVVVLFMSLIVVRIAAEALILTGLSRQAARFQARSAWTGTGFTTEEAEAIVRHPVRRQIVSILMLVRSVGVVTAVSTLTLSFVGVEAGGEGLERFLVLLFGLGALYVFANSSWVDRHLSRLIAWTLKRYGRLDTRDYADLLHLAGEYAIIELRVRAGGMLDGRSLEELNFGHEGILALGVMRRDGTYIGVPQAHLCAQAGDTLVLYGPSPVLDKLDREENPR